MHAVSRFRDGDARSGAIPRLVKPFDEVRRQERRVGGGCDDIRHLRTLRVNVIHPRQNPGERTREALYAVGDDREAEGGKARRVAIGVDDEARALRPQTLDGVRDDRTPADLEERLVAAAHPPCEAAGEENSDTLLHELFADLAETAFAFDLAYTALCKKEPFMLSRRGLLAAAIFLAATSTAFAAEKPFSEAAFAAAQGSGKPIIVHVYAPWCPTCRAQEPILQKLEADPKFAGAETFRVDFDGQKDAVKALKARNQSTIIVFKGAKEVGRSVGETDEKAISALLDKAL